MLRVGPWNRLALTIQWLVPKYRVEFEPSLLPPAHMPIEEGRVISKRVSSPTKIQTVSSSTVPSTKCDLCSNPIVEDEKMLSCLNHNCNLEVHLLCLASHFLKSESDRMLPLEGSCPICYSGFLWADLIRKMQGCYGNQEFSLDETALK